MRLTYLSYKRNNYMKYEYAVVLKQELDGIPINNNALCVAKELDWLIGKNG